LSITASDRITSKYTRTSIGEGGNDDILQAFSTREERTGPGQVEIIAVQGTMREFSIVVAGEEEKEQEEKSVKGTGEEGEEEKE
jgi:hypothetical protein